MMAAGVWGDRGDRNVSYKERTEEVVARWDCKGVRLGRNRSEGERWQGYGRIEEGEESRDVRMGNTWGGNENKGSPGKRDRPECNSSETERGTGNKEKQGKGGERGEEYECDNDIEDNIVKESAETRKGEREKRKKKGTKSANRERKRT